MPEILKQVGPQQYQYLKTQLGDLGGKKDAAEDDDDVPELVGTFEDAGKKWATKISFAWMSSSSDKLKVWLKALNYATKLQIELAN